jgi:murein DD-endopeptidase MepM/ murein hydrolase activator NlpD
LKLGLNESVDLYVSRAVQLARQYPRRITAAITALLMGGAGFTFAVANLAPDATQLPVRVVVEAVPHNLSSQDTESLRDAAMRLYRTETTRSSDTADTLLKRLGVFDPQAAAFLRSDKQAQAWLLGRAGRRVSVEVNQDQGLERLVARWTPNEDNNFKRLTIQKSGEVFQSHLETLPLVPSSRLASGVINISLFAATDDANLPDSVATQIAEIFSGDIDFHRALRKGDRFSVVYETMEADGEPLRAGRVLSAEFINGGKPYQAMWFQDPLGHGKGGYYTLAGESLRRAFLASPLEFSRVTSGFKMRFHPILQTWRAHLGVDYAATTGTPVRSVGDGVVEFAGVQNGFGNVVMVKHQNNQTTVYAHLSRINVKKGQTVSQGQHVGAVGATGWATGPHLHFEFRVNGVHRDPLTIARQSEATPVSTAAKPMFDKAAQTVRAQLASAAQLRPGSAE